MKKEMISLNDELYNEFFVHELETRLETDPVLAGGLLDVFTIDDGSIAAAGDWCIIGNNCEFCSPIL
jgi:hypothetical protein